MYEDRKEKFSFKSFFLTLLLVLLFIFLMLWLFPTKNYVDSKLQSTYDLERLSVLYDEIFANNVARMKDAAIGYFTNERMPKVVGESKKLTLQEMYDLHLVLKMKDKDGKACDVKKSYVEMKKYTEEYRLKVNLRCGDKEDYIIVYLGCYNYCPNGICEKRVSTPSKITAKEEAQSKDNKKSEPAKYSCKEINGRYYDKNGNSVSKTEYNKSCITEPVKKYSCKVVNGNYYDKNGNIVSKTDYDKSCSEPVAKKYSYEYKLVVNDTTTCPAWSNWQKEVVKATDLIKVETKIENEILEYKTITVPTTKTEVVKKQVTESYISDYVEQLVVVDTKQVKVGTTKQTITEKVAVGTVEKDTGEIGKGTKIPQNTSTTHYKYLGETKPESCSYCTTETIYTWKVYKIETVYDVVEKTIDVPVYKEVKVYESKKVPVWDFRTVEKEEVVTKTVNETKKIPVYGNVTYYRHKACKINKGYTDIKWSENKSDSALISKNYKLTGNVKEI